jgi:SAM-dependent methyltransferase
MPHLPYFAHPLANLAPRDLLLLESMPTRSTDIGLEVGSGSGSSLLRLAGAVSALHGVDIAAANVERLGRALAGNRGPARGVQLFTLDFCDPRAAGMLPTRYDLVFSCDTVEHIPRPGPFFANLHAVLKPGGRLFVTFPNESPARAHGITSFAHLHDLEGILEEAGFARGQFEVQTLEMNRAAELIMGVGWLLPRWLARGFVHGLGRGPRRVAPPQTFDQTEFFAMADRLEPLAPLINAYCWGVMKLMSLARPVYRAGPAPLMIYDTRILVRARRLDEGALTGRAGPHDHHHLSESMRARS